jgi:TetR/AcrR family transcriptional repressor of nem operon
MVVRMAPQPGSNAAPSLRDALLEAATDLFRRQGYVATTVDEICAAAGATKGAFFHHFASKEAVAEACLVRWKQQFGATMAATLDKAGGDPAERLFALLDFFIDAFSDRNTVKSCLAGTTVQEVSETHPKLRSAANACFVALEGLLQSLLDSACRGRRLQRDTEALAKLWIATFQGALVLFKASGDGSVIPTSLRHVRSYIALQLDAKPGAAKRAAKR